MDVNKLSIDEIEYNKNKFISLVYQIKREGFEPDKIVNYLLNSDFFFTPASTKYHSNYYGGLCEHCLNVFNNMRELNYEYNLNLDYTSMLIVGLFHDISKTNFYEAYIQNIKDYNPNGKQKDNIGNYDWKSIEAFKVKDNLDRVSYGKHGFNSYMILKDYINLTNEEIVALVHHHAGMGEYNPLEDMTYLLGSNKLLTTVHLADMVSTYIDETIEG